MNTDETTKEYLIVITWTDDVRYFGTPKLVADYEDTVKKKKKSTMEGVSKEFVSILMFQDVDEGIVELTQPNY